MDCRRGSRRCGEMDFWFMYRRKRTYADSKDIKNGKCTVHKSLPCKAERKSASWKSVSIAWKHDCGNVGTHGLLRTYGKLQKLFKIPQVEKAYSDNKGTAGYFLQYPWSDCRGHCFWKGAGVKGKQTPPSQTGRPTGIIFWFGLLCRLRKQATFFYL